MEIGHRAMQWDADGAIIWMDEGQEPVKMIYQVLSRNFAFCYDIATAHLSVLFMCKVYFEYWY